MPDDKIKISNASWEYFGGTTPIPDFNDLLTKNIKGEAWLDPEKKPVTLEEKFGKIPTTIQGFEQPENSYFNEQGNIKNIRDTKRSDQTFTQKAGIDIENALLSANLHNTGIGDVIREVGTPIHSGGLRMQQGIADVLFGDPLQKAEGLGNTALGLASGTFGALMTPFTLTRMAGEKVGGETVGKVAEVGTLALAGGLPLIAGYITANGVGAVTEEVTKALDLDPKDTETAQEVMGILSFVVGAKGYEKFSRKINTELGKKVVKWLDESIPEKMNDSVFRKGEGEAVPEGTYKDLLKGQDQQRIINNPPEKKRVMESVEPIESLLTPKVEEIPFPNAKIITNENAPTKPIFNEKQIKDRINEIDNEVRKAEIEGNESLYNELQAEKKKWQDQLPEIKQDVVETPEIITTKEPPVSKREQQKQTAYDKSKELVNKILDENKGLLDERQISAKLNTLIDQGKLKRTDKVGLDSIKQIKKEWKDSQPKPEKQVIKSTPNELGLKIPNEYNDKTVFNYGKNAPETLKNYLEKNPEVIEKVKDLNTFEEVSDVIRNDWNQKSEGVLSGKKERITEQADKNAPAKNLLEQVSKEDKIPDSVWDEVFGKPQTREQILKDLEQAKREGLNNVGSVLGAINTDVIKGYAKLGALNLREGAKTFDAWSKRMIEDVGDEIRPYLRELYAGIKQNAKIDDKPILEYIEKNKDTFNLDLNKVEGKIVDPNSGLEGAARHKAGRDKSTIEFNDNTQGETWYHEFAHVVNNKIRQMQPDFLNEFKGEIDKLVPESANKPLNEKFADAFVEMYTNPNAPRTRLFNLIQNTYKIPTSFELARRTNKELGFEKLPEREAGVREEKTAEWLEQKFDAPKETINEIENARNTDLYKELRDDGTQTFQEALLQSESINNITEKSLLDLDPKTLNGKLYNKAEQIKIDRIAVNKALQVGELRKTFGDKLSTGEAKTLEKEIVNLVKLQALAKNNLREAARVMESARRRNRLTPEEYELIDKIAGEIDTANKNTNLTERVKGIEKATDATLKDKAMYWWYNSVLSNPLTDIANIGGNLSNLTWEVITQPKSIIDGSFFTGLKLGWENAKRVWEGQQQAISKYTDLSGKYSEILKTKTKTGTRIKNTLLPTERLRIEDAFFRSIFENIREQQQAKLTAKEFKTTAKEVIDIYTQILEGKDPQSVLVTENGLARFEREVKSIEDYANKMVFQKELGQTGKLVQSALNTPLMLPVKMLALPFLRIAVNLTKMSLESSPVGLLKPLLKRGEYKELTKLEKQDIYRRAIAGTVILGGLASLVSNGKIEITGEAPADPRVRELWEKAGYKSNSIIVNNEDGTKTLIAYPNVSPFNITLGAVGTLMTESKYGKPKESVGEWYDVATDKALNSVLGMVRVLGNQSFLQGTSQLLTTIEKGNAKDIKKQIVRMGTPNIFSLFEGNADFGEGKTLYETEGILDQVKERLGITGDLKPKVDAYGEDRKSTYRRFPIPREEQVDKIADFLLKTGNVIGTPSNPKIQGKETLDADQYQSFVKEYKKNMYKALNRTYDLLERLQKQGEVGTMTIDRLMDALKQESRELAKQSVKEKK